METLTINERDINFSVKEFSSDDLKKKIKSLLKQASEICGSTVSLVNLCDDSGCQTLASFGEEDSRLISCANRISDIAGGGSGLMVIDNPAGNKKIASQLSQKEKERIRFYAGMPISSQTGDTIGFLCICDSKEVELAESEKDHLRTLADSVLTQLQLYHNLNQLKANQQKLERYTILLENSADATFILDADTGRITDVNNDVEKILGYKPDDLIGTLFQSLTKSDHISDGPVDSWFESVKKQNGRYRLQLYFSDKKNTAVCMSCNFTREKNRWFVSASDISEQVEAERRVTELKDKFKKVVEVATDLIYELDWESGELFWGEELTDVLGYPETERFVDYDWWLDKIHPDDLDKVLKDVSESVEGESDKLNLVYRIKTYDGSYKYVLNRNHIERVDGGSPKNIIGAIVDISELVESRAKSDQSRQLLEELAEKAWSATWIRDKKGAYIFSNEKYKELFDLSDKQIKGATPDDLFGKEAAKEIRERDKAVLESGDALVYEVSEDTDDKRRYYRVNLFPLFDIPGMDDLVGGVAIDVTEEKKSRELLEQSLEEKETLLMEIHHRVKNNLAVVSSMMQLQAFKETDERIREKLFDSTIRIKAMATIHELLYQSASFTELKFDENIKLLVSHITDAYELSVDLDISFDLDEVELNINQAIPCSLIVNEVVTNVMKHAYEDGDHAVMEITLSEDSGDIELKIRDDGRGLPDNFNELQDDGSLGLKLIDTLASQIKGEYEYRSLDRGVEFILRFEKATVRGSSSYINRGSVG